MPTPIEQRISRARTHLLLDRPWFGTLALRLKMEPAPGLGTVANDGTHLKYDETYVSARSDTELIALVAHEVMHCALGHMYRGGTRNWRKWNEACDIAINSALRAEGFALPFTELAAEEAKFKNMSAEQIYAAREKEDEKGKGQGQGQGKGQPGQGEAESGDSGSCECGLQPAPNDATNPPAEGEDRMSETDWQVAAEQALAVAKKAGKGSSNLDRLLKTSEKPNTDWRTLLRRFIEQTMPSDYSWASPNRRYISQDLYLPGVVKENMPRIGLAIDTSGSVDAEMLRQFAAEMTGILHEARPESLDVVYCDTRVRGRESFNPDDPEVTLRARGGGGTEFQPALDAFNEDPPACVIYMTDLYGPAPKEPEYPVLWAVPEDNTQKPPFGELVVLSKYQ